MPVPPIRILASITIALGLWTAGTNLHVLAEAGASAGATPAANTEKSDQGAEKYKHKGKEISSSAYGALVRYNESFEPMKKGDYAAALAKLEAALALDPNLYQARTNYGFVLGRLGRTDESIAELKKALALDPQRPEALTTLASMYQATGKLDEAIAEYKNVLQKHPDHNMAATIKSVVKELEDVIRREKAIEKTATAEELKEDYFAYATYDSVAKWNASRMPLKVYLPGADETKNIAHFRPEFSDAFKQALQEWATASGNTFTYKFVDKQKDSDIDILWTSNPGAVSRPSEGGEARVAYDTTNGISHVQIILLTKAPDGSDYAVPLSILKAACLHEIGHSLGILGHSPDPGDVMYCSMPAADQPHGVSKRDGKTIAHLYRPDVKLAHHFRDKADDNDKVALNNEGVNLAAAQQFAKAAEKFEASLKVDPAYEPAKQNLGACLNNLAISAARANNYPDAAAKFKRSLELMHNSKDKSRLVTTMKNYAMVLNKLNKTAEAQAIKASAEKLQSQSTVTSLKAK